MRNLGLCFFLALIATQPTPAQEPVSRPSPAKEIWRLHRVCPGEGGCIFGEWTVRGPVTVYEKREPGAKVAFRLKKGDKVTGLRSLLLSLKTGACRTNAAVTASRVNEPVEVTIPAKTKLWSFYYEGEGYLVAAVGDKWTAADRVSVCCLEDTIKCTEEPVYELWFEVRSRTGLTGWTKDSDQFNGSSQYD